MPRPKLSTPERNARRLASKKASRQRAQTNQPTLQQASGSRTKIDNFVHIDPSASKSSARSSANHLPADSAPAFTPDRPADNAPLSQPTIATESAPISQLFNLPTITSRSLYHSVISWFKRDSSRIEPYRENNNTLHSESSDSEDNGNVLYTTKYYIINLHIVNNTNIGVYPSPIPQRLDSSPVRHLSNFHFDSSPISSPKGKEKAYSPQRSHSIFETRPSPIPSHIGSEPPPPLFRFADIIQARENANGSTQSSSISSRKNQKKPYLLRYKELLSDAQSSSIRSVNGSESPHYSLGFVDEK